MPDKFRHVDHLGAGQFVLELGDAPLVQGLRFLGGMIFGILGKIAVRARFRDRLDDARTLDLLAPLQLLFEGGIAAPPSWGTCPCFESLSRRRSLSIMTASSWRNALIQTSENGQLFACRNSSPVSRRLPTRWQLFELTEYLTSPPAARFPKAAEFRGRRGFSSRDFSDRASAFRRLIHSQSSSRQIWPKSRCFDDRATAEFRRNNPAEREPRDRPPT